MTRTILMILLLSAPLTDTAWAKSPATQASRRDQREQADLGDRAEIYWRSVRWADPQSASVFIENPDDRVVFQQWLKDQGRDQKLTEAKVLHLQVSKEIRKPDDGRIRTATVTVSIEGYKLPGQVLKQQTVTQRWYRSEAGWFVDWSPPPPPKP
jgi:hypothetical protein